MKAVNGRRMLVRVCLLESSKTLNRNILLWLADRKEIDQILYLKNEESLMMHIHGDQPDIVMIDLGINKNHGLMLGETIKDYGESIRIVFISNETRQALRAFDVGASGYLLDPLDKGKFDQCLDKLICNS